MGNEISMTASEKKTKFKETDIGLIPEEWGVLSVASVARINEKVISNKDKIESIDYLDTASVINGTISDFQNLKLSIAPSRAKRILRNGDIVISTVRPNLKHFAFIEKAQKNLIGSTGFAVITPKKIEPKFLYYCLTTDSVTEYLSGIAASQTSTYPAINPNVIEDMLIAVPLEYEQKQIAEILSSLDDKIELNRKINANLERLASALFKKWFVDIGDELPAGWHEKSLDEVANFLNGLALQKYPAESEENYLPVIKIRELNNGITDGTDKASTKIPVEYVLKNGDVIFSWSGSLDVVIWCNGQGALNQHLFKVTSDKYPKWFYYQWIKYFLPVFKKIASDKAVTMGHIKRSHLIEAKVLVPDAKMLAKMNELMSPIIEAVINNSVEIRKLIDVRDSLLPRLMSGKIRVKK